MTVVHMHCCDKLLLRILQIKIYTNYEALLDLQWNKFIKVCN